MAESAHSQCPAPDQRAEPRRPLVLAGRLSWRAGDGSLRTAQIRTRDVSRNGVYVECVSGCGPISLYRLVDLRLDDHERCRTDLPVPLRRPCVQAAVYRVGSTRESTGLPDGYALRLLSRPVKAAPAV